ncbi:hypothetical protein BSKO_08090 [Bryopsis sp. KO-2023]|nr:hypothetical protein BSKO_08090 [Bryopsis sp. KO-2023]
MIKSRALLNPWNTMLPQISVRSMAKAGSLSFARFRAGAFTSRISPAQHVFPRVRTFSLVKDGVEAAPVECVSCILDRVPGDQVDWITDELMGMGAVSVSVEQSRQPGETEQKIYSGESQKLWNMCQLSARFLDATDAVTIGRTLKEAFSIAQIQCQKETLEDKDWVDHVKSSYKPMEIVKGWWVVPDWCSPPEPAAKNILLEPGLAFGTGDHPTTRLCVEELTSMDLKGCSVMDYGTGSGVLAIAALMAGAKRAVGVDIDPLSVESARANVELNGFSGKFEAAECVDGGEPLISTAAPFDVCVANILKGPLVELAPRLAKYVKPNGVIVLSGVLTEQIPSILEAYGSEFRDLKTRCQEEWGVITGIKKN